MLLPRLLSASSLAVPFVSQHKDTCGAAALTMVLRYWNEGVSQDDVTSALVRPELHGIAGSELAAFARARGLEAVTYRGDMAQLRAFVGKGRPLIVAWHLGGSRYHDVVVRDEGRWRFRSKRAIYDTSRIQTALAVPI